MLIKKSVLLFFFVFCLSYSVFACKIASVKDYGAIGNGVVDDTKAIQSALNDNKRVLFPEGKYLITNTLNITSGHRLKGRNCVISSQNTDVAISVYGSNVVLEDLEFDGNYSTIHGIWVRQGSNIVIKNSVLHCFMGSNEDQANGIVISSKVSNVSIEGCRIRDIDAPINGIIGDLYGSCQGVLIMKVNNCVIKDCEFENIKSEEDGDCVQVFSGRINDNEWDASTVTIKNCVFYNIWHRGIKLQASKCKVERCTFTADSTRRPFVAIDVFGNDCHIANVFVNLDYAIHAVTLQGMNSSLKNSSLIVDEKHNHNDVLKAHIADVVYCVGKKCVIDGNTIKGSYLGL